MAGRATMRKFVALVALCALAGCVVPASNLPANTGPGPGPSQPALGSAQATGGFLPPDQAARNFVAAVRAVEPVAERLCAERTRNVPCDFQIVVDSRRNQPPNAFQTVDKQGRPILGFTLALIADARNVDEIAFVMGHEAAHHILGHIPQQQQSAATGAILASVLVGLGGGGADAMKSAQEIGASIGARRFSKNFELQADSLGAEITQRAGFDALRGAAFFTRIPDPGDQFLGTHPPNAARLDTVRRAVSGIR